MKNKQLLLNNTKCYLGKESLRERIVAKNCEDLREFFYASLV